MLSQFGSEGDESSENIIRLNPPNHSNEKRNLGGFEMYYILTGFVPMLSQFGSEGDESSGIWVDLIVLILTGIPND